MRPGYMGGGITCPTKRCCPSSSSQQFEACFGVHGEPRNPEKAWKMINVKESLGKTWK